MKIERIDDKTVKCFLSKEELDAYQITYKDFIVRSEKAKEVVEDIIIQAEEEVGFQPPKIALDLQIMMLPEQGMVLTFTEKNLEEGNTQMGNLLGSMDDIGRVKEDNSPAESIPDGQTQEMNLSSADMNKADKSRKAKAEKEGVDKLTPKMAVFAFENLANVCDFVSILPHILRVKSALYKWGNTYYIHIEKSAASHDRYGRICIRALEFGRLYTAEQKKIYYLQEQAHCIIGEKALNKLRQLRPLQSDETMQDE